MRKLYYFNKKLFFLISFKTLIGRCKDLDWHFLLISWHRKNNIPEKFIEFIDEHGKLTSLTNSQATDPLPTPRMYIV